MVKFLRGYNKHGFGDETYEVDTPYTSLIWEEVIPFRGTELKHRTWRYERDTASCLSCENSSNMMYLIENTGVVGRCLACGCTFPVGPIELTATGHGVEKTLAILLNEKIVTSAQASIICERLGQVMPIVASSDRQSFVKTKREIPKTLSELAKSSESLVR